MTIPPPGDQFGGAEVLTVELEPHEAAAGADKPVAALPGGRTIIVRVPAGVEHDTVLHLFGPETPDPTIVKDLHVRVLIRPASAAPAPPPPALAASASAPPSAPTEVDSEGTADAEPTEADPGDPGRADAGPLDAGPLDAGPVDAGPVDADNERTGVLPITEAAADPFAPLREPDETPPMARPGRLVVVGAVVLTVLVGGGAVAVLRGFGGPTASAGASVGPSVSATPTTEPLTAPEYRALLTDVDAAMTAPMQEVVTARNGTALRKATAALAAAAQAGYAKLSAIAPPTSAASAHESFLRAFGQFRTLARDTAIAADTGLVCAGSAAVPKITNSPAATSLRTAFHDLAVVDPAGPLKVGAWLPAPAGEQTRRLATGTYVKKGTRTGSGQLTIDNTSGSTDALMSLLPTGGKTTAFSVYVRSGTSFTVTGVKDGTYDVYEASGNDWDPAVPGFSRDCAFAKFEDPLKYATTNGEYTIWTITLEPAVSGNARTQDVNPDDFPK